MTHRRPSEGSILEELHKATLNGASKTPLEGFPRKTPLNGACGARELPTYIHTYPRGSSMVLYIAPINPEFFFIFFYRHLDVLETQVSKERRDRALGLGLLLHHLQ